MITEEEIRKRIKQLRDFRPTDILADLMRVTSIIALEGVLEEKHEDDDQRCEEIWTAAGYMIDREDGK